jgi:hypothetical protein
VDEKGREQEGEERGREGERREERSVYVKGGWYC